MRSLNAVLAFVAAWLAAGLSFGQAAEDPPRFRVLGFGDSRFEALCFWDEDKNLVPLAFTPNRRSRLYPVPKGASRLEILERSVDAKGKEILNTVGVADLDGSASLQLLLFLATGYGADSVRYSIETLDESPKAFGPGAVRFVNLSGASLKGQLGDAVFDLENQAMQLHRLPLGVQESQPFRLAVLSDNEWRIVHSTMTRADERYGTLLVVKPPVNEDSLRVRVERIW